MSVRYAVIGAGISGLAAAVRLRELAPDADIVVLEASSRAGGKILTDAIDGFVIEGGPDAFLGSKPGGLALCRLLGIDDDLVGPIAANRRSFVMRNGHLMPLPEGLSGLVPGRIGPMLRTPLLSPLGKARMFGDFVIPARKDDRDESLASFVSRRAGSEMYERMVEPLLAGIYGGDGSLLSLQATFPQFRTAERTHGGWLKGAVAQRKSATSQPSASTSSPRGFLGFDQGMSRLIDSAVDSLARQEVAVETSRPVNSIVADPVTHRLMVETETGPELVAGAIVAVPAWAASPILRPVAPDAAAALADIEHGSTALVAIGFPVSQLTRPLDGYGYVVPRAEGRKVMAMTWVSSKWSHRAPDGQVLIRGFFGRYGLEAILEEDDDTLVAILLNEMKDVLGLDVTPTVSRVYRWERGMPQYNLGHRERIARIEEAIALLPGVEIAGNYLHGVGIPDSIVSGFSAAERLVASARANQPEAATAHVT